jgi:hypothetical protein
MIEQEMAEAPAPQGLNEPGREQPMEKEYVPTQKEALRDFEISIKFLNRGCIVSVGCKSIAFEDVSKAMEEINAYVCGDTYKVQKKWRKILD